MGHRAEHWLSIVGGPAPYREAILDGFTGRRNDIAGDTVETLADKLEASVSVVFCNNPCNKQRLADAIGDPSRYVIGIVPDLDVTAFHWVLLQGAGGVMWEDAPITHLVDVTRAALHHDLLVPSKVLRSLLRDQSRMPQATDRLSDSSLAILGCLVDGLTLRQTADRLHYSERTIQRRFANLCLHLEASTPAQAVVNAQRKGLLTID